MTWSTHVTPVMSTPHAAAYQASPAAPVQFAETTRSL